MITGDALKIDFHEFNLCAANIMYGISPPLVVKLMIDEGGNSRRFRRATILLQKEFAKRMVAKLGFRRTRRRGEVKKGRRENLSLLKNF